MPAQPSPGRLEAFSDGVIAVIITIMVLEFKVPHDSGPAAFVAILPTLAVETKPGPSACTVRLCLLAKVIAMIVWLLRSSARPLLLAGLLCLPAAAIAQNPDRPPDQLRTLSRQELDVVKVLTQQERDWNRGDLDAFATGYKNSPDILFVGRQVSRGYAGMLADYKGNYPNKEAMGTLTFGDLQPQVLDERFATVVGHYHLDRSKKAGGPAEGIFSLVFEKTDKGWKIILDHTT